MTKKIKIFFTGLAAIAASLASSAPAHSQTSTNSADRPIMWVGCQWLVEFSDADLDLWKSRGIDGFVCANQHLRTMGGQFKFTADPNHSLTGSEYARQKRIKDTNIVSRAKARGLKMYMSFYLRNAHNSNTPLKDWFDDSGWSNEVLPQISDIAGAAKLLGFDGLGFDQEMYGLPEDVQRWPWDYPNNTRSEAATRAKVRQRGAEVMQTVLAAFPNVDLVTYAYWHPQSWWSQLGSLQASLSARSTSINWYDGLTTHAGFSAIRIINTNFHKNKEAATWDVGMGFEANAAYANYSRSLANWSAVWQKLHVTPFVWIDNDPNGGAYHAAREPAYVAEQLAAARKWGTGGEFFIFAFNDPRTFDYGPYVDGIKAASTPAVVDDQPPTITADQPPGGSATTTANGTADDNMALRSVVWSGPAGSGAAAHTHVVTTLDRSAGVYDWHATWTATVHLGIGSNDVYFGVTDIKDLQGVTVRTVTGPSTPVVYGATYYQGSDGARTLSGPSGTLITAYATGAKPGRPYRLVTATSSNCLDNAQTVNSNLRYPTASGFIGDTTGPVNRSVGSYYVCFQELGGASFTSPLNFTVT